MFLRAPRVFISRAAQRTCEIRETLSALGLNTHAWSVNQPPTDSAAHTTHHLHERGHSRFRVDTQHCWVLRVFAERGAPAGTLCNNLKCGSALQVTAHEEKRSESFRVPDTPDERE